MVYRVHPGDTLDNIAKRYGLSRQELVRFNQIQNPNLIRVNQLLKIPQAEAGIPNAQSGIRASSNTVQPALSPTLVVSAPEQRAIDSSLVVVPTLAAVVDSGSPTASLTQSQAMVKENQPLVGWARWLVRAR